MKFFFLQALTLKRFKNVSVLGLDGELVTDALLEAIVKHGRLKKIKVHGPFNGLLVVDAWLLARALNSTHVLNISTTLTEEQTFAFFNVMAEGESRIKILKMERLKVLNHLEPNMVSTDRVYYKDSSKPMLVYLI